MTPLEDPHALGPLETVATLEVGDGPWGLVDPSLGGYPYLVTLEAPGREVRPPAYQVVVLGGKVPHQVRSVDFTVRVPSSAPSTRPPPAPTPTGQVGISDSVGESTSTPSPGPAPTTTPATF